MNIVQNLIDLNDAVNSQYGESFLSSEIDSQTEFQLAESVRSALTDHFSGITDQMMRSLAVLQYCWVPPYVLIEPSEIIDTSLYLAKHYAKLDEMFGKPIEWDDQIPGSPALCDFCNCDQNWNSNWIPVARFFDQEMLFMDLCPGPNGTRGQLVQVYDDDMGLWVQGHSMADWLSRITNAVNDRLFDEYLITPSVMMQAYPLGPNAR
jgi:hypothetical protein